MSNFHYNGYGRPRVYGPPNNFSSSNNRNANIHRHCRPYGTGARAPWPTQTAQPRQHRQSYTLYQNYCPSDSYRQIKPQINPSTGHMHQHHHHHYNQHNHSAEMSVAHTSRCDRPLSVPTPLPLYRQQTSTPFLQRSANDDMIVDAAQASVASSCYVRKRTYLASTMQQEAAGHVRLDTATPTATDTHTNAAVSPYIAMTSTAKRPHLQSNTQYLSPTPSQPIVPAHQTVSKPAHPIASTLIDELHDKDDEDHQQLHVQKLQEISLHQWDDLYKGEQCTMCPIRFHRMTSQQVRDHLDYHYRLNCKNAVNKTPKSRGWYPPMQLWLLSANEPAPDAKEAHQSSTKVTPPATTSPKKQSKPPHMVPESHIRSKNMCDVCKEGFNTTYDEDEEEWMLVDAVAKGGKVYHTICEEDAVLEDE